MVPRDVLTALLRQLLDKSKHKKVHWQLYAQQGNEYIVFISDRVSLEISHCANANAEDNASVIVQRDAVTIATMQCLETDEDYPLLKSLYDEAERYVTGWDDAIAELKAALEGDDIIGKRPDPPTQPPSADPEADIPF